MISLVVIIPLKKTDEAKEFLITYPYHYLLPKDISENFNAYNNLPPFSALVGDLAPEMELWADPVFCKLYLLLAHSKDVEKVPPQKEQKPVPKGKKP